MRSLILGASGQIGSHLLKACASRDHVTLGTSYRQRLHDGVAIDIRDVPAVDHLFDEFQPDTVYLACGLSQIDYAETQPGECYEVNVGGVKNVVRAANAHQADVVYISSDQVFGECESARKEDDLVDPPNVLGKSHAQAERVIRDGCSGRHLIIRTSGIYGPHELPRNPALAIRRKLSQGDVTYAANDRHFQPTYGPDFAKSVIECFHKKGTGTFHIVGGERMTEFAFARQVAFIEGYDCDLIRSVSAATLQGDALRPLNPWLDRGRFRNFVNVGNIRSVASGVRQMRGNRAAIVRAA